MYGGPVGLKIVFVGWGIKGVMRSRGQRMRWRWRARFVGSSSGIRRFSSVPDPSMESWISGKDRRGGNRDRSTMMLMAMICM